MMPCFDIAVCSLISRQCCFVKQKEQPFETPTHTHTKAAAAA
jgi:hypothetical protein